MADIWKSNWLLYITLTSYNFIQLLISSSVLFCCWFSRIFCVDNHVICKQKYFFLLIYICFLSCRITLSRTSTMMLKKTNKIHHCFVLHLSGKAYSSSSLRTILVMDSLCMFIIKLRKFPSIILNFKNLNVLFRAIILMNTKLISHDNWDCFNEIIWGYIYFGCYLFHILAARSIKLPKVILNSNAYSRKKKDTLESPTTLMDIGHLSVPK